MPGSGMVNFRNRFPEIIVQLQERIGAAVRETGDKIVADAKSNAPEGHRYDEDTNRIGPPLKESIHAEQRGPHEVAIVVDARRLWRRGSGTRSSSGRSGSYEFPYGIVVEFGSVNQAGQPFLIPAMRANEIEYVGKAKEVLASL